PALDTLIQAARGIENAENRARAFIALGKDDHMRPEAERSVVVTDAWAAVEEIEDEAARRTVILELAEFEVEQRPGEVLQAALDVMCSAEDPQAIAEAVAAVASVATRDPGTAEGALDEVGVRAGSLTNPPTKAAALAAVAGTQAEPGQRALMAQAFDSIREI